MSVHRHHPCQALCLAALAAAVLLGAPVAAATDGPARLVLGNGRLTLSLGRAEKGAILSMVDRATGREFVAPGASSRLFAIVFSRRSGAGAQNLPLSSLDASTFRADLRASGKRRTLVLTYEGFGPLHVKVTCTAAVSPGDPLVRWRLSASFPEELVLESVQFPLVTLRAPLGESAADDAAVLGLTKGGVIRRPADWRPGEGVTATQPGTLAAQFACCYDDQGGFYTAAHDGSGSPKHLEMRRSADGIGVAWTPRCHAARSFRLGYDIVQTTFAGTPTDWRDAADLYKRWALTQPWCARTYARRGDVPRWMRAGPAMARFTRDWLAQPDSIRKWLTGYWRKHFPGVPLITAYWGWEKVDYWITPDYFPAYPSDAQFQELVAWSRGLGCHAFAWPSGYHWTLTYEKQPDGSFAWDDRKGFDARARAHAVQEQSGQLYVRAPSWLAGGETACLCPGDPWTLAWWNQEVALPLARRGCELVQVDQVVGGAFPFCYSPAHGHPPGPGGWMAEAFDRQLRTMLAITRKAQPEAVVCFEEPNERFIHRVGIQDYRDCETPYEPASVFNYLYHEFLPTFQSNPREGDVVMAAYCLVNGQMPHLVPSAAAGPGPALRNGDFEEGTGDAFAGWAQVHEYQGRVWNGRFYRDGSERHSGTAALRLENPTEADIVQVSQNVPVRETGFVVGHTYRLGAWMKTGHLARPNAIRLATLTADVKPTGAAGAIAMPVPGAAWVHGSAQFTVPEGSALLRVMIHAEGPVKAWVDDMTLEEVLPDGRAATAMRPELPTDHALMKHWVDLYHGSGRPYLLFGRMLHPPKLAADRIQYRGRPLPAILHNAYRAPDGSEAVVVANASDAGQSGRLAWKGREIPFVLKRGEARLVR